MSSTYTSPWILRVCDALPGNPFWIGIRFTVVLTVLFFIGRAVIGIDISADPNDLRIALTQILLTAYFASAYAGLLSSARRTTHDLSPVGRQNADWSSIVDRAGKHRRGVLPLLGIASYLIVGVSVTNVTTPAPTNLHLLSFKNIRSY